MISLIKLAFRNCFRNKKRSLLTFLSITIGIIVLLMTTTLINGMDETTKRVFFNTNVSAIKIFNEQYFANRNDLALENLLENLEIIKEKITNELPQTHYTERLKFFGRIITGVNELLANIIGVDIANDGKVFKILSEIKENDMEKKEEILNNFKSESYSCLMGEELRKGLDLNIGDEIEVYVKTVNNAHNAITYKIVGDIYTENPEIDSFSVVVKIDDARILADCGSMVSELDIDFAHYDIKNLKILQKAINDILPYGIKAYTWEEDLSDLLNFFALRKAAQSILISFLLILAVAGITNTMLMAVFERTKEIATMTALGMKRKKIIVLFLFEGAILGFIGGIVAVIITFLPIFMLCNFGLDIPNSDAAQNVVSKIYGYFDWKYYPVSIIVAMFTASLATFYPSYKAVNLNTAQVLRGK